MGGICYLCKSKMSWGEGITRKHHYDLNQIPPKDMTENDKMCRKCYHKDTCFDCAKDLDEKSHKVQGNRLKEIAISLGETDEIGDKMDETDVLCFDCAKKFDVRHAMASYNDTKNTEGVTPAAFDQWKNDPLNQHIVQEVDRIISSEDVDDFIENQKNVIQENKEQSSTNSPISGSDIPVTKTKPVTETKPITETVSASLSEITSASTLTNITDQRHNEFKAMWQKGRVVQFKNDKIAILMRAHASQVQFIVAFDQVTREGFRLMAIDEGKEAAAGGFTGGVSSYYYFQKMDFVR